MDRDTPQPSPLRSKQERVRVRKLRNSCDACSNSKTKCDQNRPICLRCQKSGLECHYSVSQRKGKPPAASRDPLDSLNGREASRGKRSQKSTQQRPNSSELESHHEAVQTSTFDLDQDASMADMTLSVHDDGTPAFWEPFMLELGDYTVTPSTIFDQDISSLNACSMGQPTQTKKSADIFNFEDEFPGVLDIGPQRNLSQVESPASTLQLPTPTYSDTNSLSPPRNDCTKLASSTLESLYLNSQQCSAFATQTASSTKPSITSLDQILITNKSAVENAHQLLSCPCALASQSVLALSLIIDNILALYQTIIRIDTTVYPLSPSPNALAAEKFIPHIPITIGAYKLDAKDEQRMRMQLVSNELRKTAVLVDRYADRYRNLGRQEHEDKGIYTALTSLVRRRLKEAAADVVGALRTL
ncbi:MAG: hypothetical protein Q9163_003416 [Psora crenata]